MALLYFVKIEFKNPEKSIFGEKILPHSKREVKWKHKIHKPHTTILNPATRTYVR